MQKFSWDSMGTFFEISIWDALSKTDILQIQSEILSLSDNFNKKYSRFRKDSFVWKIADKIGEVEVDDDFIALINLCFDFYSLSQKKFNPLIGHTLRDMGYDETYSLEPKKNIRTTPDLLETVKITGFNKIALEKPVLFDFGGLGKGYFIDKVAHYLHALGLNRFLINGSGDMVFSDPDGIIKVGLEDPEDTKKVIGVLEMERGALAASGSNKRNWGKYHHIIDPITNDSPSNIAATWVIAETAVVADVIATSLFFCQPENFENRIEFEYLLINCEKKLKKSFGFKALLF